MNSLADLWDRSGQKPGRLYQSSTEDIIKELKAWVERRKAQNDAKIATSWSILHASDSSQQLSIQPSGVQDGQVSEMISHVNRDQDLAKERETETLLANFFLASLRHRGIHWPQMSCTEKVQADAGVCSFLGFVVHGFKSKTELKILEDKTRISQWQRELSRRDAVRARAIAKDPISGVKTQPAGPVSARFKEAIANDFTKTTLQALADAVNGVLTPGLLEFYGSRSATGAFSTLDTTGGTLHATDEYSSTPHTPAVDITGMHGNVNMAASENDATTADLNVTTTKDRPSNSAADAIDQLGNAMASLSNITEDASGQPSSAATEISTNDQALSGMDGQDKENQMSKAKKKRERRKQAKARAKEAARDTGDPHDDDAGEASGLLEA